MVQASRALGGEARLLNDVLINEASRLSARLAPAAEGARRLHLVLIDTGCTVHGYQSDITRTWVVDRLPARQRKVWDTGQAPARRSRWRPPNRAFRSGAIDDAVRAYYEKRRLGPRLQAAGPVAPHRPRHRHGRP